MNNYIEVIKEANIIFKHKYKYIELYKKLNKVS